MRMHARGVSLAVWNSFGPCRSNTQYEPVHMFLIVIRPLMWKEGNEILDAHMFELEIMSPTLLPSFLSFQCFL